MSSTLSVHPTNRAGLCLVIVSGGRAAVLAAVTSPPEAVRAVVAAKSKNQMHRTFISLIALSLSGCFADQEQQVVSCEFDAMQTYPREQLATGAHIGDFTQSCMKAHGYDWNLTDKRCQVTKTVERNPYCYTPHNSLDRLLYLIEEGEFSK
jgi:hypothetical protein